MTKAFVLTGVAAIGLAVAGCGGGSKTLSKEEYASKLNQICADYNKTVTRIGRPTSPAELASKGKMLIAEFDKALAKVNALEPPSAIEADVERFVAEYRRLRELVSRIVAAAKQNDTASVVGLAMQASPLDRDTARLGKKLGAPACAAG
jgi:hypothetical protein